MVGDHPVLRRWTDLDEREAACGIDPGDVFLVSPHYRVDARLTLYLTRSSFARLARETRRNYAEDCCVFFNFLWSRVRAGIRRGPRICSISRTGGDGRPRNPRRISGAKRNREPAAVGRLYGWAARRGFVSESPVVEREARGRHGELVRVPAAWAKEARSSNVKWLTPRAYRLWRDVGLRGYTGEGRRDPAWRGRNDDRNAAYSDLLFSSGMRRTEGGSLLTIELPAMTTPDLLHFDGRLGREVTKSSRERTFYVSADALRAVTMYVQTTRRAVIRRAQAHGRYRTGVGRTVRIVNVLELESHELRKATGRRR